MEVSQLKKKNFFIILGQIKQKKKQMLLKGGVATPSTPPLDPPLVLIFSKTMYWPVTKVVAQPRIPSAPPPPHTHS